MENYSEKMYSFSTTPSPAVEANTTTTTTIPANSLKMSPSTISYEFANHDIQQQHQQCFPVTTTSTTTDTIIHNNNNNQNNHHNTNDAYATYTDNFDLSLLPQDYSNIIATNNTTTTTTNLIDNIPTTVFNFDTTTTTTPAQQQVDTNSLAVPDIKIEQTWSSCPSLNTIKQEQIYQSYFPLASKQNQLIPPPPAYPLHIYPSPQSSPAQSEYSFPQTQFSAGCYESLSSSRNSLYNSVSSPCPSIDAQTIKQEQLHILPPSPPESSCDTPTPQSVYSSCGSGFDFKSEPFDSDVETFNDLSKSPQQDHQLLREYLQDTTFQKKHNLKPLALESFIGGLEEVRDNIEPVISLALEHAKREADATCAKLQISQDPSAWSSNQVHAWLRSTLQQYELPIVEDIESLFKENGAELLQLSEDEFIKRIPECGSTLHAQLEIWKLTYSPEYPKNSNQMQQNMWTINTMHAYNNVMEEDTEDEQDFSTKTINNTNTNIPILNNNNNNNNHNGHVAQTTEVVNTNANVEANAITAPVKRTGGRGGGSHIHLWQFLKELLAAPHINGTAIRWIDRSKGIFKIEDSVRVAKLWGKRKNRPAMNYDKLSRSIRQYYKKGIMKKTERSQRLVYQFCQPYHM